VEGEREAIDGRELCHLGVPQRRFVDGRCPLRVPLSSLIFVAGHGLQMERSGACRPYYAGPDKVIELYWKGSVADSLYVTVHE
jgi:hypothetical protein